MKIANLKIKIKAFQKLAGMDMPVRTAWKIQQNIAMLEKDFQIAENLRNDIIRKYGEDDGKGNVVVVDEEKRAIVIDELNKLDDTETENEITFKKVKLSELGNIKVAPADLYALSDVIEDDEE